MMNDTRNLACFCGSNLKHKNCHKDIVFDSDFAYLIKIYSTYSNETVSIDSNKFKCTKGCYSCCYEHFPVYSAEFIYLLYGYSLKYGIIATNELITIGSNIWEEYKIEFPEFAKSFNTHIPSTNTAESQRFMSTYHNLIQKYPKFLRKPCIFLNSKGECSVYEYRPLVCRHYPFGISSEQYVCSKMTCKDIIPYKVDFKSSLALHEKYFSNYYCKLLNGYIRELAKPMICIANNLKSQNDNISSLISDRKNISKESFIKKRLHNNIN